MFSHYSGEVFLLTSKHLHWALQVCIHPTHLSWQAASTSVVVFPFGPGYLQFWREHLSIVPYFVLPSGTKDPECGAVYHLTSGNKAHLCFKYNPFFHSLWYSLLNVTARTASWLPCYMFIINFSQEDYSQYYYQMHFLSIESALVPKNTYNLFFPQGVGICKQQITDML